MMINLNKALNRKNILVGKINHLKELIGANNSRNVNTPERWNVVQLMDDKNNLVTELVLLKTAIENANCPIRSKIFTLSELKSELVFLNSLNAREGEDTIASRYDTSLVKEKYVCTINETEKENLRKKIEAEIEKLQDEISEFNFATKIEI